MIRYSATRGEATLAARASAGTCSDRSAPRPVSDHFCAPKSLLDGSPVLQTASAPMSRFAREGLCPHRDRSICASSAPFRHVTLMLDLRSNPRPPLKLYKTAAIGRRRRDTDSETTQVNLSSPQVRQALWQSRLVCGLGRREVDRIMQP